MSLKSAPYYWYECDTCGTKSTECDEYSAYSDAGGAWDMADGSDWLEVDGKHYCDGCRPCDPDEPDYDCTAMEPDNCAVHGRKES